jgi:hypothetical protein
MSQDKRILVADAAHFIGKSNAKRLINQAWKRRFITLCGVPEDESEPVEIPFNEGGRVDCKKSRIVIGRLASTHHSVTIAWADVERLAQAEVEWLVREAIEAATPAPPEQPPQSGSNADILEAEGGQFVKDVAVELRRLSPKGPPPGPPRGPTREQLMRKVSKASGIPMFGLSTLDRARKLAWPRAKATQPPR